MSSTVVITGANRGIGLEFARQLSRAGETVIATCRNPAEAGELGHLGVRIEELDVTSTASVRAFAERLGETPIEILINNAGLAPESRALADLDIDAMLGVFSINSLGPLRVTQALLPRLKAGSRRLIVSLTSELASIARNQSGGYYAYRASKTALNMLNRTLALELAGKGFTAVVINPGWVQTRMGGPLAPVPVAESVAGILRVIAGLSPKDSGGFFDFEGQRVDW